NDWLQAMIMENQNEVKNLKSELSRNELIQISTYKVHYQLLLARYYLLDGRKDKADKIITSVQRKSNQLSPYENCLLKHILGIYHIQKEEYLKAINILKSIDNEVYKNKEYYFELAFAYDRNDSFYLSNVYAGKALQHFIDTSNYLRVIDTELLILILQSRDKYHSAEDRIEKYKSILNFCDAGNLTSRKAKIYHNLGQEYLELGKYHVASDMYEKSMDYKPKGSSKYLTSLDGYIKSCLRTNEFSIKKLLALAQEG